MASSSLRNVKSALFNLAELNDKKASPKTRHSLRKSFKIITMFSKFSKGSAGAVSGSPLAGGGGSDPGTGSPVGTSGADAASGSKRAMTPSGGSGPASSSTNVTPTQSFVPSTSTSGVVQRTAANGSTASGSSSSYASGGSSLFSKPNGTTSSTPQAGPISGGMSGMMSSGVMSSMMGSNSSGLPPMDKGPLAQQYEVGKLVASGGPSFVWKIYEAYRKSDAKENHIVSSLGKVNNNLGGSARELKTRLNSLKNSSEQFIGCSVQQHVL
ncbi:hypothetical protein HAZT_HAZT006301 [Hyalella azteca]|uniref:Uncharacterized protein n=1 Tax=Hyalella azteca TaxID=294128 RepID=A0A6A0GWL4_HYAAZ|nr:hypothetical protein HAZT_HAZT006301 [Hyalella azteca]